MKTVAIVIAVIIFAGGIGFVVLNNKDDSPQNEPSSQPAEQQTTGNEADSQPSESSNELDPNNYTEGAEIGETVDATDQTEVTVSVDDFIFETTYLKIKKGTKVTWINNGNTAHTVTSDSGSSQTGLDSALLGNGDTYEFTFNEPGLYEYLCTPHPTQMRGVITVVE